MREPKVLWVRAWVFLRQDDNMHFFYLDDSGGSRNGVTITALLIEDRSWSTVLNA